MVVFTTTDGEFAEVAERVAADRDEVLTSDFEAALERDGAFVWVDDLRNVTGQHLFELQERHLDRGPDRGAFGVVTGYTPEMAEDLYFTEVDHDGEDAVVYGALPPENPPSTDATLLTGDDASAENVGAMTDEPLRSFQILGNGRAIHIYLKDGVLCGFPESQRIEDYPEPQPFCVTDGEPDCPLHADLVDAESLDASHVFISSCAATIDNGTGGLPVHVSLALLNGADSLIGSYRVSPSRPHEILLHYSLLASGYDASERTYLLNRNSHANDIMSHPYVSFGRPDARVEDAHDPEFAVEMDADGDDLRVRLREMDAFVADVRIPDDRVPDHDDRLYVRCLTGTEHPVYYSVFEEDGDTRLLVYTGGRMSFDHLELEVSADRSMQTERRIAIDSAKKVERTDDLGFLTTRGREQADELRNQIRTLGSKTESEWFVATAYEDDVKHRLSSIHGKVNAIRDEMLEFLREEHPGTRSRRYARYVEDDDVYPIDHVCPNCEERRLFVKQIAPWSGEYELLSGQCGLCGNVFEVPAYGDAADPTYPVVHGDLDADGPRYQTIEIEFENPTDEPVQATFQPTLKDADNAENQFFEPQRRDAILQPGERHTAEFEMDTDLVADYRHVILGTVVANLELYTGYLSTVTGDEAGYYPPHLR